MPHPHARRFAWITIALGLAAASPPCHADEPRLPERLTIEEAVRIAEANHPTTGAGRASARLSAARVRTSWAGFLPSLTGSFSWSPQTANAAFSPAFQRALVVDPNAVSIGTTCAPGDATCRATATPCVLNAATREAMTCFSTSSATARGTSFDMFNFFNLQVGLSWSVFDFGRTFHGLRAAEANLDAAERGLEGNRLAVAFDARSAFYAVLAAAALVDVADESVRTQQRHVDQMRAFVQAGTRTAVDIAQTESDLAAARLQLARARGQREGALATLHAALGIEQWRDFDLVRPDVDDPAEAGRLPDGSTVPVDAVEAAVSARPEPRQVAALLRAARQQNQLAIRNFRPVLNLTLGPSFAGADLGNLTPNFNANVTLGLPAGGLNFFALEAQRRESLANIELVSEQARAVRNGIRLEAAQAVAALNSARESIQAARALVGAAAERRRLANGRFEAGLGTTIDLQDAELNYVQARQQLVQAEYDLGVVKARLAKAMGQ